MPLLLGVLGLSCVVWTVTTARSPSARAQDGLVFPGGTQTHAGLLAQLADAPITSVRPVGTTSVVLRTRSGEQTLAAFRPAATTHPRGHAHEIAAYRIAEELGLDNVPPTIGRRVPVSELQRRLESTHEDRWPGLRERIIAGRDDVTEGSMTYWIPELRELGLDQGEALREWSGRLRQGSRIESSTYPRSLLRDLSNCVLFDYLIGNTDRFSGANLQGLPDRSRVFIRDHNLAFFVELSPPRRERISTALQRSERFSRSTVARLLRLTPASLTRALSRDPLHSDAAPLLQAAQVDALFARRATLLSYLAALIDQHGREAVLVFD